MERCMYETGEGVQLHPVGESELRGAARPKVSVARAEAIAFLLV